MSRVALLFLVVALVGAFFPWLDHPVAALSFNAYDLAEWVSLIPDVRNGSPPMVAPLLLRLTFVGLALCFVVQAIQFRRTGTGMIASVLAGFSLLWLIPPIEFFRQITRTQDANHWQQAALFGSALLIIALLLAFRQRFSVRLKKILNMSAPLLTAVSAGIGTALAAGHLRPLRLVPTHTAGIGVIIVGLALLVTAIVVGLHRPPKH